MSKAKLMNSPLTCHLKLSSKQSPMNEKEKKKKNEEHALCISSG
jgi:hypothetical protein